MPQKSGPISFGWSTTRTQPQPYPNRPSNVICPPGLQSGTPPQQPTNPNLLSSWHTLIIGINIEISGYLPLGLPKSSMIYIINIFFKVWLGKFSILQVPLHGPQFMSHFKQIYEKKTFKVPSLRSYKIIYDMKSDSRSFIPVFWHSCSLSLFLDTL